MKIWLRYLVIQLCRRMFLLKGMRCEKRFDSAGRRRTKPDVREFGPCTRALKSERSLSIVLRFERSEFENRVI